jgi:hypothetical protein
MKLKLGNNDSWEGTVAVAIQISFSGNFNFLGGKLHIFDALRPHEIKRSIFFTISGPWNRQNMSVSGASMSQKLPVLFQELESIKKVPKGTYLWSFFEDFLSLKLNTLSQLNLLSQKICHMEINADE